MRLTRTNTPAVRASRIARARGRRTQLAQETGVAGSVIHPTGIGPQRERRVVVPEPLRQLARGPAVVVLDRSCEAPEGVELAPLGHSTPLATIAGSRMRRWRLFAPIGVPVCRVDEPLERQLTQGIQ
jgi:hypothetical protein